MNTYGLYVNGKDIQGYVNDYLNYGMDYMGDDNVAADDVCHYSGLPSVKTYNHFNEGFIDAAAAVLRRATPFLLWLGGHRRRFRHDGNRSECANGVLSLIPANS